MSWIHLRGRKVRCSVFSYLVALFLAGETQSGAGIPCDVSHPSLNSDSTVVNSADVASMDAVLAALYDVISGPVGQKRDWNRMRSLFVPGGKLIATSKRPTGEVGHRMMDVEGYISTSGPLLEKNGFFEKEVARRMESFGNIAHVFSTYEARKLADDATPFMRGINSIQLLNDGKRWWIVSVFWQAESPENLLPEKYLPAK